MMRYSTDVLFDQDDAGVVLLLDVSNARSASRESARSIFQGWNGEEGSNEFGGFRVKCTDE